MFGSGLRKCISAVLLLVLAGVGFAGVKGPETLRHFDEMPRVLTLPDGRLIASGGGVPTNTFRLSIRHMDLRSSTKTPIISFIAKNRPVK